MPFPNREMLGNQSLLLTSIRLPEKTLLGLLRPSLSHPKHCTSSRLTRMVMGLPISRTGCASQLSSAAHKPQFSFALMASKPPVPEMADGGSLKGRLFQ